MSWLSYCLTLFLATVSLVTYGIDIYLNYSWTRAHKHGNNSERQVTNRYLTQISPAYWVFNIWNVLYALLAFWYIYIFYLLLCRQLLSGRKKSPLFPGIFWFIFIIVNVLNALWLYLFLDNRMLISGIVVLILIVMLYLLNMMAFRICWVDVRLSSSNTYNNDDECYNDDIVELSCCDLMMLRFLTLNGLPLYAIWCSFVACVQWAIILEYFTFHFRDTVACIITLSVLSVVLLIYWHMDLLILRKYFVYSYLPLIALVVAFSAIIVRYHSMGGRDRPGICFAFVLLIVSSFMLLLKVLSLCMCPPRCDDRRFSQI